ncbi:MAG TPA: hypothetical protein VE177_00120, partial [Candidatus Binatus sp.]|nr:hypothetical protein [Candidatus Binatus sp.]
KPCTPDARSGARKALGEATSMPEQENADSSATRPPSTVEDYGYTVYFSRLSRIGKYLPGISLLPE